jgi:hypothetical protein
VFLGYSVFKSWWWYVDYCFLLFVFLTGLQFWTQNFLLTRQTFYHFSHASNPFALVGFQIKICPFVQTGYGWQIPYLCFQCRWDSRHALPHLLCFPLVMYTIKAINIFEFKYYLFISNIFKYLLIFKDI